MTNCAPETSSGRGGQREDLGNGVEGKKWKRDVVLRGRDGCPFFALYPFRRFRGFFLFLLRPSLRPILAGFSEESRRSLTTRALRIR